MTISALQLKRFTAFQQIRLDFSPGLNVLIATNGTGKSHLMKAVYAACSISQSRAKFPANLLRVFMPSGRVIGRLVKRQEKSTRCTVEVFRNGVRLRASFTNSATRPESATVTGVRDWKVAPAENAHIPVKEMLADAPRFRSLYAEYEVDFEEICADIFDCSYLPATQEHPDATSRRLLAHLQQTIGGKVLIKGEEFYLRSRRGDLDFPLLAEGMCKLALIWLLIQNGILAEGSKLLRDEPETNLNPRFLGLLGYVLLTLQRLGNFVLVQFKGVSHNE